MVILLLALLQVPHMNGGDRRAYALAEVGLVADCGTTVASLQRGNVERNPFLSQRPGTFHVISTCVMTGLSTYFIGEALPRKWRRGLFYTLAIVGFMEAIRNTRVK